MRRKSNWLNWSHISCRSMSFPLLWFTWNQSMWWAVFNSFPTRFAFRLPWDSWRSGRCGFEIFCWARIAMVVSKKRCIKSIFWLSTILLNAVKTSSSLLADVDTCVQLQCRAARLRNFFTVQSQRAPCVMHNSIPAMFWKTIENNNRCT